MIVQMPPFKTTVATGFSSGLLRKTYLYPQINHLPKTAAQHKNT